MNTPYPTFMRGMLVLTLALLASCGGSDYGGSGGSSNQSASDGTGVSGSEIFSAALTGASETPPNQSAATGTGTLSFDPASKSMTASVTTSGIAGTMAHIHEGAAGVPGPIIFPLNESYPGVGIWSTRVTLTDAQVATLQAGRYYFNVHSAAFPAGEIRGQIGR